MVILSPCEAKASFITKLVCTRSMAASYSTESLKIGFNGMADSKKNRKDLCSFICDRSPLPNKGRNAVRLSFFSSVLGNVIFQPLYWTSDHLVLSATELHF